MELVRGGQESCTCDRGGGWDARSKVARRHGGGEQVPRGRDLHACIAPVPTSLLRAPSCSKHPRTYTNPGAPTLPEHLAVQQEVLFTLRHTTNPHAPADGLEWSQRTHNTTRVGDNGRRSHSGWLDVLVEPVEGRGGEDEPLALTWVVKHHEQRALQMDVATTRNVVGAFQARQGNSIGKYCTLPPFRIAQCMPHHEQRKRRGLLRTTIGFRTNKGTLTHLLHTYWAYTNQERRATRNHQQKQQTQCE